MSDRLEDNMEWVDVLAQQLFYSGVKYSEENATEKIRIYQSELLPKAKTAIANHEKAERAEAIASFKKVNKILDREIDKEVLRGRTGELHGIIAMFGLSLTPKQVDSISQRIAQLDVELAKLEGDK